MKTRSARDNTEVSDDDYDNSDGGKGGSSDGKQHGRYEMGVLTTSSRTVTCIHIYSKDIHQRSKATFPCTTPTPAGSRTPCSPFIPIFFNLVISCPRLTSPLISPSFPTTPLTKNYQNALPSQDHLARYPQTNLAGAQIAQAYILVQRRTREVAQGAKCAKRRICNRLEVWHPGKELVRVWRCLKRSPSTCPSTQSLNLHRVLRVRQGQWDVRQVCPLWVR